MSPQGNDKTAVIAVPQTYNALPMDVVGKKIQSILTVISQKVYNSTGTGDPENPGGFCPVQPENMRAVPGG